MILFPAIDLKDGRCVRLKQGDMAQATIFNDDPADQAAFVAGRVEAIEATRTEPGCLEYVMAADPADGRDPGRRGCRRRTPGRTGGRGTS